MGTDSLRFVQHFLYSLSDFCICKLNVNVSSLFNDFGIVYIGNQRTSDRKTFTLLRKQEPETGDGMTMNDD